MIKLVAWPRGEIIQAGGRPTETWKSDDPAWSSLFQTRGSEVIADRDAELSDVVEIRIRVLAVGDEGAN